MKILGDGELTKKLSVTAHRFSKSAREKIEAAGGTATALREPVEKSARRGRRSRAGRPSPRPAEEAPAERRPRPRPRRRAEAERAPSRPTRCSPGSTNAWRVPELRRRVLFTAMILALYRLGSWIPAPGVDPDEIKDYLSNQGGTILSLLNIFSGGALAQFALFALGIMPYVTASIILQLMTVVVPRLEQLQKEGEAGYAKINQYTRYLTVVLAALQALGYTYLFNRQSADCQLNAGRFVLIVVSLTAATTLLMWMGELITKRGIGNGISLLIFASILSSSRAASAPGRRRPHGARHVPASSRSPIIVAVVFVQEGQRRIPIQYAKRMVGRRMTSGGSTYMPLRVNMAGVIPIIFAAAIMAFPPTVAQFFPATQNFINDHFTPTSLDVPAPAGVPDRDLHVLLHGGSVQPGRSGGQPAQARRLHPRHPARARRRRSTSTAC